MIGSVTLPVGFAVRPCAAPISNPVAAAAPTTTTPAEVPTINFRRDIFAMLLTFQGHTQCLDNAGGLRMRIHQPKTTTPEAEEWITFRAGVAAGSDLFLVFFN